MLLPLFIVTTILIIIIWYVCGQQPLAESMINVQPIGHPIKYSRTECKTNVSGTVMDILREYNITSDKYWDLKLPCSYNWISSEIDKIKPDHPEQRIFIIDGIDELTSKQKLWNNLVEKYGRIGATGLSPLTYDLNNNDDMKLFNKEYHSNGIYILKKNIQRQEGIFITRDRKVVNNGADYFYVVAQELLQDPYTIRGRKINLRVYVLILCRYGKLDAWVFNDGFMYYTKVPFKKDTTDRDPNITTGYIDRSVYAENPLTHDDFRKYLDCDRDLNRTEKELRKDNIPISGYVFNNINNLIKKVVEAAATKLGGRLQENYTFQLLGADVAIDEELGAKIIEINKGPDLGAKDERDSKLKHKVVRDMFNILKLAGGPIHENGFIPIIF